MNEQVLNSTSFVFGKYLILSILPFVEPQIAGILGGLTYLIVRHELKMASMSFWSIVVVMFFGWIGAWATVNIIAVHYSDMPHVWIHILSATVGFLSYDTMLIFGANTTSVVVFFAEMVALIIRKVAEKWKS